MGPSEYDNEGEALKYARTDRIASRCSGFHLLPATRRVPPIWCLPARPITQRSEGVTIDKKLTDAVATGLIGHLEGVATRPDLTAEP